MSQPHCKSVDEYIASQPETTQAVLDRVRSAIRESVPKAEEGISYKMPAYKLQSGRVLYFAAWKRHFSLYPATADVVTAFGDEIAPYAVNKGTIRFPLSQPVPVELIGRIAKFLAIGKPPATEVSKRGKPKTSTSKTSTPKTSAS